MKNLRSLAWKFELDQRERKSSQVHASHGQTELQVNASFQLVITCDSVWPGLKIPAKWTNIFVQLGVCHTKHSVAKRANNV